MADRNFTLFGNGIIKMGRRLNNQEKLHHMREIRDCLLAFFDLAKKDDHPVVTENMVMLSVASLQTMRDRPGFLNSRDVFFDEDLRFLETKAVGFLDGVLRDRGLWDGGLRVECSDPRWNESTSEGTFSILIKRG